MRILRQFVLNTLDPIFFKQLLLGGTVVVLLFIPFDIYRILNLSSVKTTPQSLLALQESAELQPLPQYLTSLSSHSLFGIPEKEKSSSIGNSIKELTRNFRLQGIVVLEQPEAILNDAGSQKTFFVKQGERLGELTLKAILADSVVLVYGDEKIEIKMADAGRN